MSESRHKPGVAFWATMVIVAMIAYPLSFGPACWISSRMETGSALVSAFYRPMMLLIDIDVSPAEVKRRTERGGGLGKKMFFYPNGGVADKYSRVWAASLWRWRFAVNVDHSAGAPVARADQGYWEWSFSGSRRP